MGVRVLGSSLFQFPRVLPARYLFRLSCFEFRAHNEKPGPGPKRLFGCVLTSIWEFPKIGDPNVVP